LWPLLTQRLAPVVLAPIVSAAVSMGKVRCYFLSFLCCFDTCTVGSRGGSQLL
jgi:hypothetical protein